ncbi:MAG: Ig-like domain-containing protein [Lachnospiraceae bacterium]|nr:Ig-like domain-containing protein [Lachnospiraceae bacterium]
MNKRMLCIMAVFFLAIIVVTSSMHVQAKTVGKLSKVKVNKTMTLNVNGKKKLQVKNLPKKAKVTYRSENRKIASVNAKGYVVGKKQGKTAIKVKIKYGKKTTTKRCEITVRKVKKWKINIQVGDKKLTATLVNNSSTKALVKLLSDGPVTIEMEDYANMEKVGDLPKSLPRNDKQMNTDAGDLILYQGRSFVIYYGKNSWELTKLGKIDGVSKQELKKILGNGDVTVTLSLGKSIN